MNLRNILILLAFLLALGGYFYWSNIPEDRDPPTPQIFVWLIDMEEIQHIEIRLPNEDESQSFIKKADRIWYFDDPQQSEVDIQRWGGGIPLILSGPGAARVIAENATDEDLTKFGLTQPQMEILLTLNDGNTLNIKVGKRSPDGINYYVQAPRTNDVALVDYTWYGVLERLVKEPPYVLPEKD